MFRQPTTTTLTALLAALLSLSFAAGCPGVPIDDGGVNDVGSDGGGDTPTARAALEQAVDELAACAVDHPMLELYPDLPPEGMVTGSIPVMEVLPFLDASDELSLDDEATFACADLLNSYAEDCDMRSFEDDASDIYDRCDSELLVTGTRAAGEDCTTNTLACAGTCEWNNDNGCSMCVDYLAEGDDCEDGGRCTPGTDCRGTGADTASVCLPPAAIGEGCERDRDCASGAFCNDDDVCEAERAPGEPCDDNTSACQHGCRSSGGEMFCAEPRTYTKASEGEACHPIEGGEGEGVFCDLYEGLTCVMNMEGETGICTPFEIQAPGEPCDAASMFIVQEYTFGNRVCGDELEVYCHIDFFGAAPGTPGECRTRAAEGAPCQSSSVDGITVPCGLGLFCEATGEEEGIGTCVPRSGDGEACLPGALETFDWGCDYGTSCEFDHPDGPTCVSWEDIDDGQPMCTDG